MNRYRKYKSDKIINKILENHFNEFKEKKWNRVRKEMREHIINIVERALECGNIEKGYIIERGTTSLYELYKVDNEEIPKEGQYRRRSI
ncbi:MAG: hypothetical protein RRZ84_05245 [Romboutsia sp.]